MPTSTSLLPAAPTVNVTTSSSVVTQTPLPGCQWRKKLDTTQFGSTASSASSPFSSPIPGRKQSVIVRGFFGGGKSPPIKSAGKGCLKCLGKGAVDCTGCKGTGKNKKNGNMFERWKCYDCQGFGLVGCPNCGTGGLTPEQRRER